MCIYIYMAATPQTIPSYAEKLPYLDSIHDFWKERSPPPADGRLKAKPDQEDAEFNIPQPKKVLGILRGHLLRTLGNHITTPPIDWPAAPHPATHYGVGRFLNTITDGGVRVKNASTLPSNYERNVEKWFEETYPALFANSKEEITYAEIMKDPDGLKEKYRNSRGSNYILRITVGNDYYPPIDNDTKRNTIANFILNYFLGNDGDAFKVPPDTGLNRDESIGLTSDAKIGLPHKICRDFKQVYNLVTPANIADSAPTSFKALVHRNKYVFPRSPRLDADPNHYIFNSNYFTDASYQLLLINKEVGKNFSKENPFGFSFGVQPKWGDRTLELFPFGPKQKQGPSVNYLVDLTTSVIDSDPPYPAPKINTILRIDKLLFDNGRQRADAVARVDSGLLYDIKRGGDYEQIEIIKNIKTLEEPVIFSTIDILAALWARLKQQDTILHYNDTITLFRFPEGRGAPLDENRLFVTRFKNNIKKCRISLDFAYKIINDDLGIGRFQNEIIRYLRDGLYFSPNINKKFLQKKFDNFVRNDDRVVQYNDEQGASAATRIVNIVIKIRLLDIYIGLSKLRAAVIGAPDAQKAAFDTAIGQLNTLMGLPEWRAAPTDATGWVHVRGVFENTVTGLKDFLDISHRFKKIANDNGINFIDKDGEVVPINKEFFTALPDAPDAETRERLEKLLMFNKSGENPQLKFSNKSYSKLFNALNILQLRIGALNPRDKDKKYYNELEGRDYFTSVNKIYTSFFDSPAGEAVNNILMPSAYDSRTIENWYGMLQTNLEGLYAQSVAEAMKFDLAWPPVPFAAMAGGVWPRRSAPKAAAALNDEKRRRRRDAERVRRGAAASAKRWEGDAAKATAKAAASPIILDQFLERSDLLRHIAGLAAQFIESYWKESRAASPAGLIRGLMPTVDDMQWARAVRQSTPGVIQPHSNWAVCLSTIAKIRSTLFEGLTTLQNQEGYVPQYTDYQLMYLLSFYTRINDNGTLENISPFDNTDRRDEPTVEMGYNASSWDIINLIQHSRAVFEEPHTEEWRREVAEGRVPKWEELARVAGNDAAWRALADATFGGGIIPPYVYTDGCPPDQITAPLAGTEESKGGEPRVVIPVEITNLLFLTLIDNTMQSKPKARAFLDTFFPWAIASAAPKNMFETPEDWISLITSYLPLYMRAICDAVDVPPPTPPGAALPPGAAVGGKKSKKTRRKRNKKSKKTRRKRNKKSKKTRRKRNKKLNKKTKRLLI